MDTRDALLTVNAGSSSIKFALFAVEPGPTEPGRGPSLINHGQVEGIGTAPHLLARDKDGAVLVERRWPGENVTHEAVFTELLQWTDAHLGDARLVAAGHRVVHGGRTLIAPAEVTPAVLAELDSLVPLAPLHQPHSLNAIRALTALRPDLLQVACFDTAFHHTDAAVVRRIALPRTLTDEGIERYGFHGLSYEYIASTLPGTAPGLADGKVVVAHLGNGASLCALASGRSVDTTMGFTALDGLPMGTRCGALDPGVILYLLQAKGMSASAVERLLYSQSGLLGVSGVSSDMRALVESRDPHAREAIELFAFHIARQTGALAMTLGGLDGFVFTAGIGEHVAPVRRMVCERLAWLGVAIDEAANERGDACISTPGSRVAVWVIPTDEELMIARHALASLRGTKADPSGSDEASGPGRAGTP